jgi:hypothetical protein
MRCPGLGREKPNETGKLIDGVPVCAACMLEDARGNGFRVIDYSFLKKPVVKKQKKAKR